jgi:hypothetical protein
MSFSPKLLVVLTAATLLAFVSRVTFSRESERPEPLQASPNSSINGEPDRTDPQEIVGMQTGCDSEPNLWLSPLARKVTVCFPYGNQTYQPNDIGVTPLGAADANGDGSIEHYDVIAPVGTQGVRVYSLGTSLPATLLYSSTTTIDNGEVSVWRNRVLRLESTDISALRQVLGNPALNFLSVEPIGWRDLDEDGDLDLIARAWLDYQGVSGTYPKDLWFENTGFEHGAQCNADLNNDGAVDGGDLCLLLACWTSDI